MEHDTKLSKQIDTFLLILFYILVKNNFKQITEISGDAQEHHSYKWTKELITQNDDDIGYKRIRMTKKTTMQMTNESNDDHGSIQASF